MNVLWTEYGYLRMNFRGDKYEDPNTWKVQNNTIY